MPKKYFYGEDGRYYYDNLDVESAVQFAIEYNGYAPGEIITIVKMTSCKAGGRFCTELQEFIEGRYDCDDCDEKKFIGKSHHCKHKTYGLLETGAKWEYVVTEADYNNDKIDPERIRKISGRKKDVVNNK